MSFNFLVPVSEHSLSVLNTISQQALGNVIKIHSKESGIPELDDVQLAIIGVKENRNSIYYKNQVSSFDNIRQALYTLYPGNWHTHIVDLGDINPGAGVEDTYFALKTIVSILTEKNIIPIVLGGSQDLTYAQYRAYDTFPQMVNIVNIDTNFDLGDANLPIKNNSYLGKIITEKPYNLFNYTVIGYQTYFNSQEEIDLMEKLYFEAYRLGEATNEINSVEPLLRDANIVSLDLKAIRASDLSTSQQYSANGFTGREICAVARYAGISHKVSSFGIYEYQISDNDFLTASTISQIVWYFIEGVNYRVKDDDFLDENQFSKITMLIDQQPLIFYKSLKTERWWIQIPFLSEVNNKLKKHTLLPCMHKDYLEAQKGIIPKRWYKACQKNSF